MNARDAWVPGVLGAAVLVGLLAAGEVNRTPVAPRMAALPEGTVTVFHRRSTGSLGDFVGEVRWVQQSAVWRGQPVVMLASPLAGASLHEPDTLAVVATQAPGGAPYQSFDPPLGLHWPLQVGQAWTSEHSVFDHARGSSSVLRVAWRVESWGEVSVPAGRFKAYRVRWTSNQGESETRWVCPERGLGILKRHLERSAGHSHGPGSLDAELIAYRLPAGVPP